MHEYDISCTRHDADASSNPVRVGRVMQKAAPPLQLAKGLRHRQAAGDRSWTLYNSKGPVWLANFLAKCCCSIFVVIY